VQVTWAVKVCFHCVIMMCLKICSFSDLSYNIYCIVEKVDNKKIFGNINWLWLWNTSYFSNLSFNIVHLPDCCLHRSFLCLVMFGPAAKLRSLYNLHFRFQKGRIYTYIGEVVVSVNPYKSMNIYTPDTIKDYKGILGWSFVSYFCKKCWNLTYTW